MQSNLVHITRFSGRRASIYSVAEQMSSTTTSVIIDRFIASHKQNHLTEVLDIARRLHSMGHTTGCTRNFFKEDEGLEAGDLVCALYDVPDRHLRLFCIRLSNRIIIVGSGGPKTTRTWQEDMTLSREVHVMMHYSAIIRARLKNGDLNISASGLKLEGNGCLSKT